MINFHYCSGAELSEFLYEKCRQDPDLLATIIDDYLASLSDNKLIELEDFLTNNFGDDWLTMRIFFTVLVVLLVANIGIELLDSSMIDIMQQRNETLQKIRKNNWFILK